MDQNISMVRFLMFIILALIIFFNLAPQVVANDNKNDDGDNGDNTDSSGTDGGDNDTSAGKYCLVDGESHADKECEEISDGETCQNQFTSLQQCQEWKSSLEYDTVTGEEGSLNYVYKSDDIDKLTITDSDDMIYCLKNDKKCKKMKFGDCNEIHIGTYLSKKNCLEAKHKIKENKNDYDYSYDERYCFIDNTCKRHGGDNDCEDRKTYCNMNKCKKKNNVTQDEGEYCFNGSSCDQMSCSDTSCDGKYYTSLSTCKSNNGLS